MHVYTCKSVIAAATNVHFVVTSFAAAKMEGSSVQSLDRLGVEGT